MTAHAARGRAPDTRKARVLVVGDVMLDRYWFGEVSRISPEAPVPVVRFRHQEERLGGAANVANNCVQLGARTQLLSVTGADEAGDRIERLASEAGIKASLHRDPRTPTTVKLRVLSKQQLLRVDFETPPSGEALASKLAEFRAALPACNIVILSDYGKGGLAHIARMIGMARAAGKRVLVDPKGDDWSRYKGAHVVTPNRKELADVVGTWKSEGDLERRVRRLRAQLGLDALLLTRGHEGMSLYTKNKPVHVKAEAREVYDVSGAGDTVIATLGTMLASGVRLEQAMRIANRAGGIKVAKLGTAVVTRRELFG
ncbi:MAG TPA: D-glycero-beta-D-manno-heptose-7-phosphate kinase [Burkholderiales bacterium]|nr:D-glycero-beta-D-manno-heptose-7-phosphate kinase [Burkholderiales bacterium]